MVQKPIDPVFNEDEHGYQIAMDIQKYDTVVARLESLEEIRKRIKNDRSQEKTLDIIHEQGAKLFKEIEIISEIIDADVTFQNEIEGGAEFDFRTMLKEKGEK